MQKPSPSRDVISDYLGKSVENRKQLSWQNKNIKPKATLAGNIIRAVRGFKLLQATMAKVIVYATGGLKKKQINYIIGWAGSQDHYRYAKSEAPSQGHLQYSIHWSRGRPTIYPG